MLDGTDAHDAHAGYLKAVTEGWAAPMTLVERPGLTPALAALAEEMNERLKGTSRDRQRALCAD